MYDRVIPGTAPAYCSRVDEVRSQLLHDDGESLFASPGQQQEQVKRKILTHQVNDNFESKEAAGSSFRNSGRKSSLDEDQSGKKMEFHVSQVKSVLPG